MPASAKGDNAFSSSNTHSLENGTEMGRSNQKRTLVVAQMGSRLPHKYEASQRTTWKKKIPACDVCVGGDMCVLIWPQPSIILQDVLTEH